MKGVCHASFFTIRKFIRDVVGIKISRGYLRKLIGKMTDALKPCYDELLAALPNANSLNIDETGHKKNGEPPNRSRTFSPGLDEYWIARTANSAGLPVKCSSCCGVIFLGRFGFEDIQVDQRFLGGACDCSPAGLA